jgi:hypothetical protein
MNLFMHYAFDSWMKRTYPQCPFARYADDAVVHCRSQAQAEAVMRSIALRLEGMWTDDAPRQVENRLLQRQQPDLRLSERAVYVSGLYVSAQGGAQ